MDGDDALVALVALAMVVGLVGTAVPFVPGLLLVWGAGLVYGLAEGFGTAGAVAFGLMTVLAVAGFVANLVLPPQRAEAGGAARTSVLAGLALGVVGVFVVPVVGLPLGAVAGVLLAEYGRTRSWGAAWEATKGVIVGFGLGVLAQLAAGLGMVACWIGWVVLGQ
jgi:uncharacterized protein